MRIIEPFAFPMFVLDEMPMAKRIELCGRLCYKSEDKMTADSSVKFVENIISNGHNSVLEMAAVTFGVDCCHSDYIDLLEADCSYLHISKIDLESKSKNRIRLLLTGSIRAWRNMLTINPECYIVRNVCFLLAKDHPYFFADVGDDFDPLLDIIEGIEIKKIRVEHVDAFDPEHVAKHRHVAVKFVVSRAVSHELVRHRPCSFLQESQRYCRYSEDKFGGEVTFIKPMFWAEDSAEYAVWQQAMQETERHYLRLLETSTAQAARQVLPNACKTEIIVHTNLEEWQHIFKLRCSKAAEPSMREVMVPLRAQFAGRWPEIFAPAS